MHRQISFVFFLTLATVCYGQDEQESADQKRYDAFTASMEKTVMVGTFTVDADKGQDRKPERYEISKIVKQDVGDYWTFFARIKYGDHDVTLPIPVEIKWAAKTPVITVDELTIPGMGTFDARVLIHDKKYAGTWRHGKVSGLMFGHIEKQSDGSTEEAESTE